MHPIAFELGPIAVRYYGLMYVVAIIVGTYLLRSEVRRKEFPLTDDNVINFVLLAVVFGVAFARLYYVAFNWDYYSARPLSIPAIWEGGLAIHGGLVGGVVAGYIFTAKHGIPFWRFADAVIPSVILGQTFGRFGNFMNGDAHGTPTSMPWGIVFPRNSIAGSQFPGTPLHPTMLYEMALNFSIFLTLWRLRKRQFKDGFLFSLYFILYPAGRFVVEAFRADSLMIGSLRAAQLVSIALIVIFGLYIYKNRLWEP